MRVTGLSLRQFRNYRDLSLAIPPGIAVFYGHNGQGKTNLLESLYVLLRGESFRAVTAQSLVRDVSGQPASTAAVIEGRLIQSDLKHEVRIDLSPPRKEITWNNRRVTSATVARQFPLVLFSPESLMAIKEGPDLRRQLVDEAILTHSPASHKILKDFRRALQVRNRVLRDAQAERTSRPEAIRLLESLDPSYLPLASALTSARLRALNALAENFKRAARAVLDRPNVDISVDYLISGSVVHDADAAELLSTMHQRALEMRVAELGSGSSLVGPHKHDIRILFDGKDSRFFCSQGQQRALILSFKMAQILYHHKSTQVCPFLLLDDVLSELDPARRKNLIGFLRDIPAQIFLTTTDLSFSPDFGDRRLSVFKVENGTVTGPEHAG